MATNADPAQERIEIPARSTVIGVDGAGNVHYLGNRVTADGIPIYVEETDGNREVFDLRETPCWDDDDHEDPIDAWIAAVERKHGDWDRVEYGRSLVAVLGEAVEPEVSNA